MADPKRYGVYQPGRVLISGSVRCRMGAARKAFMEECQCDDWGILKGLGYRVMRVGRDLRGKVRAQPLSEPGLLLPGHEHEQQPSDLINLLVAQFQAYRQSNHDNGSD